MASRLAFLLLLCGALSCSEKQSTPVATDAHIPQRDSVLMFIDGQIAKDGRLDGLRDGRLDDIKTAGEGFPAPDLPMVNIDTGAGQDRTFLADVATSDLSITSDSVAPRPWVFLLAGQSNMLGLAHLYNWVKQSSFGTVPAQVEFYVKELGRATSYDLQHDITGDGVYEFGPEITFIAELAQKYPAQEIIIVKYAVGGTSMADWLPSYFLNSGALTSGTNPLFDQMVQFTQQHLGGRQVDYKAVLWMQGASDAIEYNTIGQRYSDNLNRLIALFRQTFQTPSLPFLISRNYDYTITGTPGVAAQSHFTAIRVAQEAVATSDPSVHLITTDNFVLNDVWHFNGTSQFAMGRCFADVFASKAQVYACPLQSGYDQAPIIIFSATVDGPPRYSFAAGSTYYARALAAGTDANNIKACLQTNDAATSCSLSQNWTTSAPWTYDAASGVWRNTVSNWGVGDYFGFWAFKVPDRQSFGVHFNVY